jgi:hypothetical protein
MTEQQNPTNKFPGPCAKCSKPVTAKAGILRRDGKRFVVFHSACAEEPDSAVIVSTFIGEHGVTTITRNRRGTCIDAPCCGCCS